MPQGAIVGGAWFLRGRSGVGRAYVRGTDGYIFRSVFRCALLVQRAMWVMGLASWGFFTGRSGVGRAHVRGTDGYIFRSVFLCALVLQSAM